MSPFNPAEQAASYCVVSGDIDMDGDLDLITQSANEYLAIYINQTGSSQNSVRLTLRDDAPNVYAVGAMLRLTTAAGVQWREIRAGGVYKSSAELAQTIGIGDQLQLEQVLVRWPDGDLSIVEDLPAGSSTIIDRSQIESYQDCNHNFIVDSIDIINDPLLDIDGNGIIDSCTLFIRGDSNGDQVLNIADVVTSLDVMFGPVMATCDLSLDCNDDSLINIADPIYLLGHLFSGGPTLPPPGNGCGTDPTAAGTLLCDTPPFCP